MRNEEQLSDAVLLYHHTGAKALHGFRYESIQYTKKPRPIYKKQRSQFSNNERKAWIKHIAEKNKAELLEAGLTANQINIMLNEGRSPEGYQVHHRIPLDDGGSNNFENLILIRDDVEHRSIHGYYNPGELRIDLIAEGERANVVVPLPPVEAVVYPNKTKGFHCDDVPNSQLVELYDVD